MHNQGPKSAIEQAANNLSTGFEHSIYQSPEAMKSWLIMIK